jgi:hypothetical protein
MKILAFSLLLAGLKNLRCKKLRGRGPVLESPLQGTRESFIKDITGWFTKMKAFSILASKR